MYSVEESLMTIEVGVTVTDGMLSREVEVIVRSVDGTARSTCYTISPFHNINTLAIVCSVSIIFCTVFLHQL